MGNQVLIANSKNLQHMSGHLVHAHVQGYLYVQEKKTKKVLSFTSSGLQVLCTQVVKAKESAAGNRCWDTEDILRSWIPLQRPGDLGLKAFK